MKYALELKTLDGSTSRKARDRAFDEGLECGYIVVSDRQTNSVTLPWFDFCEKRRIPYVYVTLKTRERAVIQYDMISVTPFSVRPPDGQSLGEFLDTDPRYVNDIVLQALLNRHMNDLGKDQEKKLTSLGVWGNSPFHVGDVMGKAAFFLWDRGVLELTINAVRSPVGRSTLILFQQWYDDRVTELRELVHRAPYAEYWNTKGATMAGWKRLEKQLKAELKDRQVRIVDQVTHADTFASFWVEHQKLVKERAEQLTVPSALCESNGSDLATEVRDLFDGPVLPEPKWEVWSG